MKFNVAANIKRYMDESGITITFLAKKLNMSPDLLSKKLKGSIRLSADEFIAACEVLKKDPLSFKSVSAI